MEDYLLNLQTDTISQAPDWGAHQAGSIYSHSSSEGGQSKEKVPEPSGPGDKRNTKGEVWGKKFEGSPIFRGARGRTRTWGKFMSRDGQKFREGVNENQKGASLVVERARKV